jgi:HSP20 family protein
MPKKNSGSFFGKIMGDNTAEETETVSQVRVTEIEPEELTTEEDEEEMEVQQEEYEEPVPPSQPAREAEGANPQQNEDWLTDYEGQLNIDMYQTKDNVIIKSTIAGVRPEDIDITVANDMVTIKGSRRREENVTQDDYFYQECYWGNFSRSVIIPVDIDSENIEADLKDGILTVIVPKAAKAKTKKVKVKGL